MFDDVGGTPEATEVPAGPPADRVGALAEPGIEAGSDPLTPEPWETHYGGPPSAGEILSWVESGPIDPHSMLLLAELDPSTLPPVNQVRLARAWNRVEAAAAGAKLTAVAAFTHHDPGLRHPSTCIDGHDSCSHPEHDDPFSDCEISAALQLSLPAARDLLHQAIQLDDHLPATLAALQAGQISHPAARRIIEPSYTLPPHAHPGYETRLLPIAHTGSPGQVAAAARRAAAAADPEGFTAAARAARTEHTAIITPDLDGTATLFARLAGVDAAILNTAMDTWARTTRNTGDPRPLNVLRPAALTSFAETYLQNPDAPRSHNRPITINITIDLPTYLGLTGHPGHILPDGLISAEDLRELIPQATLRRLITDPLTGELLDYGRTTYRIPAPLAAFVLTHDVTSPTPSSTTPTRLSDIDHRTPYPDGPTNPDNLLAPNRRWHRAKTLGGWTVTRNHDHTLTWTSPLGLHYTIQPYDHRLGP